MAGGPFEGMLMKIQFDDPLFEAWTQRPILTIAEGVAEIGEIKAPAARLREGDRDAWYREWTVTADRLYAQAEECAARGARISARYLYQRASTYYRNSYPLLFGRPIDPRVKSGYAREAEAFARAAALFDPPITPVVIPFESVTLPGWFYSGGAGQRPLLICTNGYDETIQTMHYGSAAAAQRRGHHVLHVRRTRAWTRAHRGRRTYAPGLGDGRSRRGRLRLDAAWRRSLANRPAGLEFRRLSRAAGRLRRAAACGADRRSRPVGPDRSLSRFVSSPPRPDGGRAGAARRRGEAPRTGVCRHSLRPAA